MHKACHAVSIDHSFTAQSLLANLKTPSNVTPLLLDRVQYIWVNRYEGPILAGTGPASAGTGPASASEPHYSISISQSYVINNLFIEHDFQRMD